MRRFIALWESLFCWVIAISMIVEICGGWYMVGLNYNNRWYHSSLWLHKSIGMILMALAGLKVGWFIFFNPVSILNIIRSIRYHIYGKGHIILYLLILLVTATGYFVSTSSDKAVSVFGLFDVPSLFAVSDKFRDMAIYLHFNFAYALALLIVFHVLWQLGKQFLRRK